MKLHGWGRFPITDGEQITAYTTSECIDAINNHCLIPRGMGRSYGDSANGPCVLQLTHLNHFISFDMDKGLIICESGVLIRDLLRLVVPRGWFIPVTPGTSYITIGGAIASDVHGKNHHKEGTFSQFVESFELLLGTGEIIRVSKSQNFSLFHATCGGMGLTGVILTACIKLKKITSSLIEQTTIKTKCLDELIDHFNEHVSSTYSVAWIDCLSTGKNLGRSLLMLGEHANDGQSVVPTMKPRTIPIDLPSWLLNKYSIKAFNTLYYHRVFSKFQTKTMPFEPFFYPLDKVLHWNRLYGKQGFVQYQFVLPKEGGVAGLKELMKKTSDFGKGSFLAVLKLFGPSNDNLLSFPTEGYTLALDFKAQEDTFQLINQLNHIVLTYGGRVYLTKDALMSEAIFKASYPQWQAFEEVRAQYGAIGKFASNQSKRLGLS